MPLDVKYESEESEDYVMSMEELLDYVSKLYPDKTGWGPKKLCEIDTKEL